MKVRVVGYNKETSYFWRRRMPVGTTCDSNEGVARDPRPEHFAKAWLTAGGLHRFEEIKDDTPAKRRFRVTNHDTGLLSNPQARLMPVGTVAEEAPGLGLYVQDPRVKYPTPAIWRVVGGLHEFVEVPADTPLGVPPSAEQPEPGPGPQPSAYSGEWFADAHTLAPSTAAREMIEDLAEMMGFKLIQTATFVKVDKT